MIFQSFTILAIKYKLTEVQKRAISKKNYLNQIDLMYFMLKAHLRGRSRLKLAIYESHFYASPSREDSKRNCSPKIQKKINGALTVVCIRESTKPISFSK